MIIEVMMMMMVVMLMVVVVMVVMMMVMIVNEAFNGVVGRSGSGVKNTCGVKSNISNIRKIFN
jgi:hypothetical protein